MFNIDSAGNLNGSFVSEDAASGRPPTMVSPDWLNAVQAELVAPILQSGLALNKASSTQLMQALAILQRQQTNTAYLTSGTAPEFMVTLPASAVALAALSANLRLRLRFHAAGAGNDTLAIGSLAAKNLKQYDWTGAKVAGVIAAGQLVDVEYDGTDFVLLDPLPQAMGNLGGFSTYSANTTLPLTDAGKLITVDASSGTRTISIPTTGLPKGSVFKITRGDGVLANLVNVTSVSGSVSFIGMGNNKGGTAQTTVALRVYDTLEATYDGVNFWCVGGSSGVSLNTSGYQKLSSGLIMQWVKGASFQSGGATTLVVNFPIAFPNALLFCGPTGYNNGSATESPVVVRDTGTNLNQATFYCANAVPGSTGIGVFAIGY